MKKNILTLLVVIGLFRVVNAQTNDIETLTTYFMEYEEELVAAETEAEEAEKEAEAPEEEDPLAGI